MAPVFERPFKIKIVQGLSVGFHTVIDKNGRIVAQGSKELAERVMKEGPF